MENKQRVVMKYSEAIYNLMGEDRRNQLGMTDGDIQAVCEGIVLSIINELK